MLALQRIINRNPVGQGIPMPFMPILRTCPPEQEKDFIQECQTALSKALFNKNSAETFWALLEEVYGIILKNPLLDVNGIFNQMDKEIKKNAKDFGCNIRHRDDCIERLRSNHEVKECCDGGR